MFRDLLTFTTITAALVSSTAAAAMVDGMVDHLMWVMVPWTPITMFFTLEGVIAHTVMSEIADWGSTVPPINGDLQLESEYGNKTCEE